MQPVKCATLLMALAIWTPEPLHAAPEVSIAGQLFYSECQARPSFAYGIGDCHSFLSGFIRGWQAARVVE
jgi:hypothetical protein